MDARLCALLCQLGFGPEASEPPTEDGASPGGEAPADDGEAPADEGPGPDEQAVSTVHACLSYDFGDEGDEEPIDEHWGQSTPMCLSPDPDPYVEDPPPPERKGCGGHGQATAMLLAPLGLLGLRRRRRELVARLADDGTLPPDVVARLVGDSEPRE